MTLNYLFWYSDTTAPHKTYVAVKVLSANATGCIVSGLSAEYEVFKRIKSANPRHPGFAHCLSIRHCFILRSSAGGHICFSTDVLGPNIDDSSVCPTKPNIPRVSCETHNQANPS